MYFVEYTAAKDSSGYCPPEKSFGARHFGRRLHFYPKAGYDGRRIEEFEAESEAEGIVRRFPRQLNLVTGLVTENERGGITALISAAMTPVLEDLELLTAEVEELRSALPKPRVKKTKANPDG